MAIQQENQQNTEKQNPNQGKNQPVQNPNQTGEQKDFSGQQGQKGNVTGTGQERQDQKKSDIGQGSRQ